MTSRQAYLFMRDYPDLIAHLLGVLDAQAQIIQRVALDSPARLILHGEHLDSQFTPPPIFKKNMLQNRLAK
ncbi:MAG: hypothetical protein JW934_11525 [Anaerolineae bacterium]|nr:hypothetical protein [Anaerolineae bacterium]